MGVERLVPAWKEIPGPIHGDTKVVVTRVPGDASAKLITKYGADRVYLEISQPGIGVRTFALEFEAPEAPPPTG